MNKIRRGDQVIILAGRDKGNRGIVRQVINDSRRKPERVIVDGINMVTHYQRPNPQKNEPGGIIKREASLHVSNVAVIDSESGLPARVKIEKGEKGKDRSFHVSKNRKEQNSEAQVS